MKKKKILFLSYGGGHANLVRLVYNYLQQMDKYELKVISLTLADKIFDRHNVPYVGISHYLNLFEDKDTIIEYGKMLAEKAYNPLSGMKYDECVAYLGLGFRDLVLDNGYDKALELFEKYERKAACPEHAMKVILAAEQADLLVLTAGVRFEKAAGLVANKIDLPILHIQDNPEYIHVPYNCFWAVMNGYLKQRVIESKLMPEEKIFVTGQPVFADIFNIKKDVLEQISTDLKINNYQKMIIFLEQNSDNMEVIEEKLIEIAHLTPKCLYVFKLHPNQDEKKIKSNPENIRIIKNIDVKYLLHLADLAITKNSTSGLEASFLGKNLITVALSAKDDWFSKFGITYCIHDINELGFAISECMKSDSKISRELAQGRSIFCNNRNALDKIAISISIILSPCHTKYTTSTI